MIVCKHYCRLLSGKFEEEYESWESCLSSDARALLTHIFETPRSLARRLESSQNMSYSRSLSQSLSRPQSGSDSVGDGADGDADDDGEGTRQTIEEVLSSGLPILRRVPCPVPLCTCTISEEDLSALPEYVDAYSSALVAIDAQRSHRSCCLQEVMDCDRVPAALTSMVCLGCSHFYHPACFLHMVKAEMDGAINKGSQIACYMCRADSRRCDCPECLNRKDLPESGAHVINQSDIDTAQRLLLDVYKTDAIATRSGHPHLAPSSVKSLVKRWDDIHASVSVAAVFRSSSSVMFECRCGSVYEVDKPSPSDSGRATPPPAPGTPGSSARDTAASTAANDTTDGYHVGVSSLGRRIAGAGKVRSAPPPLDTGRSTHGTIRCVNATCGCVYCAQVNLRNSIFNSIV
jgi:hypothetical protein